MDLYNNNIGQEGLGHLLKLDLLKLNIGGNALKDLGPLVEFLPYQQTRLEVLELGDPSGFSFQRYSDSDETKKLQHN